MGVDCIFHKVNLRPGKPLWFGHLPASTEARAKLVFGLPGNPVSGFVCSLLFLVPTLKTLGGEIGAWDAVANTARLSRPFSLRGGRPTYWPGKSDPDGLVEPLEWHGSADPFTMVAADCLIFFPEGNRTYDEGASVATTPIP